MAGVHPFMALLEQGADVIIGGTQQRQLRVRGAGDPPRLPRGRVVYLGKVLECASFCAEPYGGKETVLARSRTTRSR
jgi:hypothetical protein